MFIRRLTRCLIAAAVLAAPGLAAPAGAKPPDLPVDPTIDCREREEGRCSGSGAMPMADPSEYTCPYLKQKTTVPSAGAEDVMSATSVLDNLKKLTQARKLYRQAEHCRHTGKAEDACRFYEEVQGLCPGSRYDRLAQSKERKLRQTMQLENDAAEESSIPDVDE